MTKEELESKFEDLFDANTRASEGGYGADTTDRQKLFDHFYPVVLEYAKQQGIEFFKYLLPSGPYFDASIANRYHQFIEHQNKEK